MRNKSEERRQSTRFHIWKFSPARRCGQIWTVLSLGALLCFVQKEKWQRASQRLVGCGGKIHFKRYMLPLMLSSFASWGHQYFVFYGGWVAILRHDSYDETKMGICDAGVAQFQFLISRIVKTVWFEASLLQLFSFQMLTRWAKRF